MLASRISQSFVLAIGLGTIWAMTALFILTSGEEESKPRFYSCVYEENGDLFLISYSAQTRSNQYRRWDAPDSELNSMPHNLSYFYPVPLKLHRTHSNSFDPSWSPWVAGWGTGHGPFQNNVLAQKLPGELFQFVASRHGQSNAYLVQVDLTTRRVRRYIGTKGASSTKPTQGEECFQVQSPPIQSLMPWGNWGQNGYFEFSFSEFTNLAYLKIFDGILKIDTATGNVTYLYKSEYQDACYYKASQYENRQPFSKDKIYIRTNDKILVYVPHEKSWGVSWPIPLDLRDKDFQVFLTFDDQIVFEWTTKDIPASQNVINNLVIANDGSVVESRLDAARNTIDYGLRFKDRLICIATLPTMIAAFIPAISSIDSEYRRFFELTNTQAAWSRTLQCIDMIIVLMVMTAGCLTYFWLIQTRNKQQVLPWQVIFIVTLGVPGLVALLLTQPMRRDSLVSKPELTGIEIFV